MKRTFIVGAVLSFAFVMGCADVKSGRISKCKHCNKEIENTVQSVKVPSWDAQKYKVESVLTYCEPCGNEQMSCKIHFLCKKCAQEYKTDTINCRRSDEKTDQTDKNKYCDTCGRELVPFTCAIVCPSCGSRRTISDRDYRSQEDVHRNQTVQMVCEGCQKRVKREEAAKKVGDVIGGIGGAIGKGISDGVNRNR